MALLCALLGAGPSSAAAFEGRTDEAVSVWQHRDAGSPTGWDTWYSVVGRPNAGDPSSTLGWHAAGGVTAAPIAALPGDDKNPHVFTNGGRTVAVWQHAPGTGSAPGDWDIFYATQNADGTWTPPSAVATQIGDDYDPNISIDSNGNALAVWVHRNPGGNREILWSVLAGSAWSPPVGGLFSGDSASLPEVSVTSVSSVGGVLLHRFVAAWADGGPGSHKMWYSIFDGVAWLPPAPLEATIGTAIADVGFANYLGTDPDPYGAEFRQGVTADAGGDAYVIWGGSAQSGFPGVVGAIVDVPTNTVSPMLTPFGSRFIGVGGCHSPDDALTTGGGDFVGVFPFAGFIEDTFRTGGAFTPESFAYDSPQDDLRPSNAAVSATEMISVNWGAPQGPASEIHWAVGTVTPGTDVTWGSAQRVVPAGQDGEDMFPEITSAFAGQVITGGLELTPQTATNDVGTQHTVTAKSTVNGEPQAGVEVQFTVTGANSATGSCVTGPDGTCTFTYTGTNAGIDTITATATVAGQPKTATAQKEWVAAAADLAIRKRDNPDPVRVGHHFLTYTMEVTNNGPADATGVEVLDNVPHEVHIHSVTPSQGSCTVDPGNHVHCHLGSLAAGETATIVIEVVPEHAGVIVNEAIVSGDQTDPDDSNNTVREETTVLGGFSCRATGVRIGTTERVVANPQDTPCRTDSQSLLNLFLPAGSTSVRAAVVNASTDSKESSPPQPDDHGSAHADAATVTVKSGLNTITVSALEADASYRCAPDGTAVPSSSSRLARVTANGRTFVLVSGRADIPLVLATLRLNETTRSPGVITQRALVLDSTFGPDVVVGEAKANEEHACSPPPPHP